MSLVVNHNLMAANVANNLSAHYGNLATSTMLNHSCHLDYPEQIRDYLDEARRSSICRW